MTTSTQRLTEALLEYGYFIPTGVTGVYGRSERYEEIVRGFEAITAAHAREEGAETVTFPPVIPRQILRETGYMESFPDLCGSIHSYDGTRRDHLDLIDRVEEDGDWSEYLDPTPLTLCPAACYPLYPTLRGALPAGGRVFDVVNWIFRCEPSEDPGRLQSFRVREMIRVGEADAVLAWRDATADRALDLLRELGLDASVEVASDPFFGRAGQMMAASQVEDRLKLEVVVPISSVEAPTAVCSFNAHRDKFGNLYDIRTASGDRAHSACLGYGLERVVLALLERHGFAVDDWPPDLRKRLAL